MLWKDPNIHLKNNKVLAAQRLESLEKRLIKNPDKAKQYSDTIKKYVELGHGTKLSTTESSPTNNMTYYMPHHYVTNPNKQNKLRVVFDASAKYILLDNKPVYLSSFSDKNVNFINNLLDCLGNFKKPKTNFIFKTFSGLLNPPDLSRLFQILGSVSFLTL